MSESQKPLQILDIFNTQNFITNKDYVTYKAQGIVTVPNGLKFGDGSYLNGDFYSVNGTLVLDVGTDGTDATFNGDVNGDLYGDIYQVSNGTTTKILDSTAGTFTGDVTGNVTGDLTGDIKNADGTVIFDNGNNSTTPSFTQSLKVIGEIAIEENYGANAPTNGGLGYDARLFIHDQNVIFATEAAPNNLDTQKNAGISNTIMGCLALSNAIPDQTAAGGTWQGSDSNTAIGNRALLNCAETSNNVAIGNKSGEQTNSSAGGYNGFNNTWLGANTGPVGTIGLNNATTSINNAIAIGQGVKATADYECRIGTSTHNVVIPGTVDVGSTLDVTGATTLASTSASTLNVTGTTTLASLQVTGDYLPDSNSNIKIGTDALANATATNNIGIGDQSLYYLTGGAGVNTAIGYRAGYSYGGNDNTFIGANAGYDPPTQLVGTVTLNSSTITSVTFNNAALSSSLQTAITGMPISGSGIPSGSIIISCTSNSIFSSGKGTANGSNVNLYVDILYSNYTNSVAIGAYAQITANSQISLGSTSTAVKCNGSLECTDIYFDSNDRDTGILYNSNTPDSFDLKAGGNDTVNITSTGANVTGALDVTGATTLNGQLNANTVVLNNPFFDNAITNDVNYPSANPFQYFYKHLELKGSDQSYRQYYIGSLGEASGSSNVLAFAYAGGSGDQPKIMTAINTNGDIHTQGKFIGTGAELTGTLDVTGATTLNSTLDVTGATTLNSTLNVTGATTLASTLAVTGATTLSSLNVTGNITGNNIILSQNQPFSCNFSRNFATSFSPGPGFLFSQNIDQRACVTFRINAQVASRELSSTINGVTYNYMENTSYVSNILTCYPGRFPSGNWAPSSATAQNDYRMYWAGSGSGGNPNSLNNTPWSYFSNHGQRSVFGTKRLIQESTESSDNADNFLSLFGGGQYGTYIEFQCQNAYNPTQQTSYQITIEILNVNEYFTNSDTIEFINPGAGTNIMPVVL